MRPLPLLPLLLLLPLLAGCFGPSAVPLPLERMVSLRTELQEIDRLSATDLEDRTRTLTDQIKAAGAPKERPARTELAHQHLLLGYSWERRGEFKTATTEYYLSLGSEYASVAVFRIAQIAQHQAADYAQNARDTSLSQDERELNKGLFEASRKQAIQFLEKAANFPPDARVLLRSPDVASLPGTWAIKGIRREAYARLDAYYRTTLSYQVFQQLVRFCGGERHRKLSYVLALILLAVLAKLITTPLSLTQFKSMRAMQAVQPALKKLQEKYKDDKAALAREQMALFKEHGINPVSGCLPMLIQLPILMWVYWGIRHFTYRFMGIPFLYLPSLGDPDVITVGGAPWPGPLLIIYGVSMYVSQKLISPPAATPEQRQQQKLLAYMMPVMFVILFRSLPAAFILYWLLMNVLVTGHQYLIMRPQRQAAEAPAVPPPAPPPPPEAIRKLSQGSRPSSKKKRRRRGP
jgi:YidC/Oxa1 family membrane protein insertase